MSGGFPLSFRGRLRRIPYIGGTLVILALQYALVAITFAARKQPTTLDWEFFLLPSRALAALDGFYGPLIFASWALVLLASWALASLSFRRAVDAGASGWLAAATIAPVVQLPVILLLWLLPSRAGDSVPPERAASAVPSRAAIYGVLAGTSLTVAAVAVGALLFGAYGYGMFVVSPFLIGAITGYFANRDSVLTMGHTSECVALALLLGGVALVAVALEGLVCIVLAAPLALGAALVGGALGRAMALARRPASHSALSISLIPLVFASEQALPPGTRFTTQESIEIAAPASAVWSALLHMDRIEEPPALPFRLGVAYPTGAAFIGSGVGATRLGHFSTGTATERVTEWVPDRKLAFAVLSDPPSMRELSPYAHVHAPHVRGYFVTTGTSFELVPLSPNRTRIVEHTSHLLKLDPVLYWLPFARLIIHANNARVLAHLQHAAERGLGGRRTSGAAG
jgi:uncharacterized membrane protein YhaH (DUF805 family)